MKKLLIISLLSLLPIAMGDMQTAIHAEQSAHNYLQLNADQSLERFLNHLAIVESGVTWDTVNSIGAMGAWQFTERTLRGLGYDITVEAFKADASIFSPELQREAIIKLIEYNESELAELLDTASNRYGILAAAHLAGAPRVKKYFTDGYNAKDKYGTSIETYLAKFSGDYLE